MFTHGDNADAIIVFFSFQKGDEAMQVVLGKMLGVRRGEWKRTILMFCYFYLTIAAYYILRTCRKAYFVHQLGADLIPWVTIAIAIITGIGVYAYSRIVHKTIARNLINGSLIFLIICLAIFWWAFHWTSAWVPFMFYIYVTIFSAVAVTQFWTFANDIFDSQEAKRVYGFVGAGGLIGGMTGGYISSYFAPIIGTHNLLLFSGAIIVLCICIVTYLWNTELVKKRGAGSGSVPKVDSVTDSQKVMKQIEASPWQLICKKRYLMYLLLLVGVTKFTTNLTEWQLDKMADIYFANLDTLTSFYGKLFGALSAIGLIIQLFCTPFFLRRFGAGRTLMLLPGGLIVSSVLFFLFPAIWSVALLKIVDGSLRYSIYQSAKEYVYLPIASVIRLKIKPFIDMFVYQFAKGFASLFILFINGVVFVYISNAYPHVFDEQTKVLIVGGLVFVSLLVWFVVVWCIQKEHIQAVRDCLIFEHVDTPEVQVPGRVHEKAVRDMFCASLGDNAPAQIREQLTGISLRADIADAHDVSATESIIREIKTYMQTFDLLCLHDDCVRKQKVATTRYDEIRTFLRVLLQIRLDGILDALGVLYNKDDTVLGKNAYYHQDEFIRANGVELLTSYCDEAIKKPLVLILDGPYSLQAKRNHMKHVAGKKLVAHITALVYGNDILVALAAVLVLAEFKLATFDAISSGCDNLSSLPMVFARQVMGKK